MGLLKTEQVSRSVSVQPRFRQTLLVGHFLVESGNNRLAFSCFWETAAFINWLTILYIYCQISNSLLTFSFALLRFTNFSAFNLLQISSPHILYTHTHTHFVFILSICDCFIRTSIFVAPVQASECNMWIQWVTTLDLVVTSRNLCIKCVVSITLGSVQHVWLSCSFVKAVVIFMRQCIIFPSFRLHSAYLGFKKRKKELNGGRL